MFLSIYRLFLFLVAVSIWVGCSSLKAQVKFHQQEYVYDYYTYVTYTVDCRLVQSSPCMIDVYVLSDSCFVSVNGQQHLFNFDNTLVGNVDSIVIEGSVGRDVIMVHGSHSDIDVRIYSHEGNDYVEIVDAISADANLGSGDDVYRGSFYDGPVLSDAVYGGPGDDIIEGRAGADLLCGGPGDDQIWGHNGIDYLMGDDGNDVLRRGNDEDVLEGGLGADVLLGDSGDDVLWGNAESTYHAVWGWQKLPDYAVDELTGGPGSDEFHAAYYSNKILYVGSIPLILKVYVDTDVLNDFVSPSIRNPFVSDKRFEYYVAPFNLFWPSTR